MNEQKHKNKWQLIIYIAVGAVLVVVIFLLWGQRFNMGTFTGSDLDRNLESSAIPLGVSLDSGGTGHAYFQFSGSVANGQFNVDQANLVAYDQQVFRDNVIDQDHLNTLNISGTTQNDLEAMTNLLEQDVQENYNLWHVNLTCKQNMLTRLWHRAITGCYN